MFYTKEQIKRANERSISEYFRSAGYDCKQIRSETHIAGFGGFYVKDTVVPNQFYVHSQQTGGIGLVSCLMKVLNMPFKEAVQTALDGEQGRGEGKTGHTSTPRYVQTKVVPKPEPKPEFEMPQKGADNRKAYSYLTKTRYINPEVVNAFIRAGVLFQDTKGNAVFLHSENGKPCGAEIHGTGGKSYTVGNSKYSDFSDRKVIPTEPYIAELLDRKLKNADVKFAGYVYEKNANIVADSKDCGFISNAISEISDSNIDREAVESEVHSKLKNYKGVAPGTTESYFSYDKGNPQKAFVFESSIDLMSFISLHPDVTDCKFAAMAGLKPNVVEKLLEKNMPVTLCVDNDTAGEKFAERFGSQVKVFTECRHYGVKDFNELLTARKTVPFKDKVNAVKSWANDAIQKINETNMKTAEVAR